MKPLGKKHTQRTQQMLANQGVEMTPAQIRKTRKKAYAKIRAKLRERGFDVPDSDEELFLWMKAAGL